MIRRPVDGDTVLNEAAQGARQLLAVGVEDGEMVQAYRAGRRGRPTRLSQTFNPMW